MKLVDTSKLKDDDNRCRAITGSGKRCKRSAIDGVFCQQHLEKYKETSTPVSEYPPGELNKVPEPPEDLDHPAKGLWRQVCEALLNQGLLTGIRLHDIYDLCWWDSELRTRRKELMSYGPYNEYVTESGHRGRQRSGVAASVVTAQGKVEDIRSKLWLTIDGDIKFKNKSNGTTRPGIFKKKPLP